METKETHTTGNDCLNVCKGFVTQSALGGLAAMNFQFSLGNFISQPDHLY